MQAFGNDYVYINAISESLCDLPALARFVSDRHFAIGSDGMVLICPSDRGDFRMRMFNPDGTEGEMCGNALRSVGKYVYDHALTDKTELVIETLGGMQKLTLTVEDREARDGERAMPQGRGFVSNIRADIGCPCLDTAKIPVNTALPEFVEQRVRVLDREFFITAVSWGNPHVAMFTCGVDTLDVEKYGRAIEYMTELFPNKTNVTFAEVISRDEIKIREWERGTGETIGCGTGCCTAAVAGVLTGRCNRSVTVHQIGGPLFVEWDEASGRMFMTGPSHNVFEGEIDISHLPIQRR
jgi:diaminopimelate epimerase